ncbi:MAG: TIGR03986 family CRISPR-associated RAMP protein [Marinisporobacter sp.]|nr:TIGR03986 family CRISPR-associated RAMP protein [Marinisporobacter sp.]
MGKNKENDKNNDKKGERTTYAKAPYNFIPFPEKVVYRYNSIDQIPKHHKFDEKYKSGYIEYTIEVETPLCISDGKDDFFKVNDTYAIPGSTVRGKIRSNAEILSCAYPRIVEDKTFWYRGVADQSNLRKEYWENVKLNDKNIKINDVVKAGYLSKQGEQLIITRAQEDENGHSFKLIHESKLRNFQSFMSDDMRNKIFMYNENVQSNLEEKDNKETIWDILERLKEKRKKAIQKKDSASQEQKNKGNKEIKDILEYNKNPKFQPYIQKFGYRFNRGELKGLFLKINPKYGYGYLMNSTNMGNKQNHYLIYQKSNKEEDQLFVENEVKIQYETSVKYRHNTGKDKFNLNFERIKEKPVFYILDENQQVKAFGFTPYLKISYKNSIHKGIKIQNKEEGKNKLDYVQGLFGFTNFECEEHKGKKRRIAYKGRVSFTNAKYKNKEIKIYPVNKNLLKPNPTSFQLYLKQESNNVSELKTYNQDDFELRGQKFYWLKKKEDRRKVDKKGYTTTLHVIDQGKFTGKIYFENLYADELGLLLMAIKPLEDARDNLGQGKPYGFGKVNFNVINIKELDRKERFTNLNIKEKQKIITKKEMAEYKDEFIKYMKEKGIEVDFEKSGRYKNYATSKRGIEELEVGNSHKNEFEYMRVEKHIEREILKNVTDYEQKVQQMKIIKFEEEIN